MSKRAIAIFAKTPLPGRVKTRLIEVLGAAGAADLAAAFVRDTLASMERASERARATCVVFFDPPDSREAMRRICGEHVDLRAQVAGNLTARLDAARIALEADGFTELCFVGSDSPTLPLAYIGSAFASLARKADVAIGPASDGGYYLIAMRADRAGLFSDIAWSTERVFAQTLERIRACGLTHVVLPPWYDVDDETTLRRLREELRDLASARSHAHAPATATATAAFFAREALR